MMKILSEKTEQEFSQTIARLRASFRNGDAKAGYALTIYLDPENEAIDPAWRQQFSASRSECERLLVETLRMLELAADRGDGEAMHLIGQYYQAGIHPVHKDIGKFCDWCKRAVRAGYAFAANDLYALHNDPQSTLYDPAKAQHFLEIITRNNVRVVH